MALELDFLTIRDDQVEPFTETDFYKQIYWNIPTIAITYKYLARDVFTIATANNAVLESLGNIPNFSGLTLQEAFAPDDAQSLTNALQACVDAGHKTYGEVSAVVPSGQRWISYTYVPMRDSIGNITHVLSIAQDITEEKLREQELLEQEQLLVEKDAMLLELSTPLLAISDTTVVMPLIGSIDSRRAQLIMETLLQGISKMQCTQVILDITGILVMDTSIAAMLIQVAQAVRLLGAQIILTGIRPEIAQTMVSLGIDMQGIVTRSSLQSGITYALGNATHT